MLVGVTGSEGFTGRYLAATLAARGHRPLPLVADVRDADAVATELAARRPDAIVHLAAKAFVQSDDMADFYSVNQVGTFTLLDAAARLLPGITVLLASSAQVYGAKAEGLIDEDAPLAPANHYALSKAAMEMGSGWWRDQLRLIIARPFNYTGVGQETRYLLPKIVDHFRRRAPVIELGNMDVRRDFGDVRAVAEAYCGLTERGQAGAVLNISTGRVTSVREVLVLLEELTGHHPAVRTNPTFVRANDVAVLGGDNARLRSILPQWQPRSLRETLSWMLSA